MKILIQIFYEKYLMAVNKEGTNMQFWTNSDTIRIKLSQRINYEFISLTTVLRLKNSQKLNFVKEKQPATHFRKLELILKLISKKIMQR